LVKRRKLLEVLCEGFTKIGYLAMGLQGAIMFMLLAAVLIFRLKLPPPKK
jgi:hypothetical protein